ERTRWIGESTGPSTLGPLGSEESRIRARVNVFQRVSERAAQSVGREIPQLTRRETEAQRIEIECRPHFETLACAPRRRVILTIFYNRNMAFRLGIDYQ